MAWGWGRSCLALNIFSHDLGFSSEMGSHGGVLSKCCFRRQGRKMREGTQVAIAVDR